MTRFKIICLLLSTATLAACSTVKMPNIDFMGSSEFEEEARNIDQTIPDPRDAPPIPTDTRNAEEWDEAAKSLNAIKDGFSLPEAAEPQTAQELSNEFQNKKAKAQAYKADDPQ
jgi:hypothetical protein